MGNDLLSFDEALKAEYSEPSTVIDTEPQQPPIQELPPGHESADATTDKSKNDSEPQAAGDWRGNPLYYQTGKKAGQLRKTARQPLVAFEEKEGDSVLGGELITGSMFLAMIDLILPGLIVVINNMAVSNPKYRMNLSDMQLDRETHDRLQPLANATLRRVKLRGNPLVWLSITLMATYSFKYAQVQFDRKYAEAMEAKEKQKAEQ